MRRLDLAVKLAALPLTIALMSGATTAQGPIGSATLSGPVRLDGVSASGTVQVMNAARLSTGDNASGSIALSPNGTVTMAGQADVVVTRGSAGPQIQLVCGEVTVQSTSPVRILSVNGGLVVAKVGRTTVMSGGKPVTIKEGKQKEFGDTITVDTTDSTVVVTSKIKCNCNCN